jgi:hypothetical protein
VIKQLLQNRQPINQPNALVVIEALHQFRNNRP